MGDHVDFAGDLLSIGATTDRKWTTFDVSSYNDDGVHLDRDQTIAVITELAGLVDHVLPQPVAEPDNRFSRNELLFLFILMALVSGTIGALLF